MTATVQETGAETGTETTTARLSLELDADTLARAQAGQLSEAQVWAQFVGGMPLGLPQDGDEGLDRTHTWARTYWGGALFCMLADIEIRERTGNRKSIDDAFRAVVQAGRPGHRRRCHRTGRLRHLPQGADGAAARPPEHQRPDDRGGRRRLRHRSVARGRDGHGALRRRRADRSPRR